MTSLQYLYLEVSRQNIVEEALIQMRQIAANDLRKPLKVFKHLGTSAAQSAKNDSAKLRVELKY